MSSHMIKEKWFPQLVVSALFLYFDVSLFLYDFNCLSYYGISIYMKGYYIVVSFTTWTIFLLICSCIEESYGPKTLYYIYIRELRYYFLTYFCPFYLIHIFLLLMKHFEVYIYSFWIIVLFLIQHIFQVLQELTLLNV